MSVLGNEALLMDVLRVASGRGAELEDRIVSEISKVAARIDREAGLPAAPGAPTLDPPEALVPAVLGAEAAVAGVAAGAGGGAGGGGWA